ncbi:MAG: dTDP-4-dehydrorhamnose 3,5-epimerase [Hyphomicrobiaceae bacterium]|jgi:dTDP-4-dehydrorhamnose 3,5-epimerase
MQTETFDIAGPVLITPRIFRDERGFFSETFNRKAMEAAGLPVDFVQDNHSLSVSPGVIRGLHFQTEPHAQGKLVRVTRGAIYDVAVDIRRGSPTYGRHVAVELSARNWRQLWVPAGFAHGFCTIEPDTEVLYKVTDFYAPDCDRGLAWNDPALGIAWPVAQGTETLSDKDRRHPPLSELPPCFHYAP